MWTTQRHRIESHEADVEVHQHINSVSDSRYEDGLTSLNQRRLFPRVHVIKDKVHFENDVEINAVYCMKLDFYTGCRSEHQHKRDSAFLLQSEILILKWLKHF